MDSYFSKQGINNTSLGFINLKKGGSLQKFKQFLDGTLEDEEQKYRRTGSLVHLYILEPEKFKVAEIEKPSDTIIAIVDAVYNQAKFEAWESFSEVTGSLSDHQDLIETAVIEAGYQSNWKIETRVAKVIEQGSEYFKYLYEKDNSEDILLTGKEFATIMACSASLKTDPHISKVMFPVVEKEHIEVLREKAIFFNYKGFDCKAKLDMLILNHKQKKFFIVDLKTTSRSVMDFNESFNNFDYYRQFAFYELACMSEYSGYTPFDTHACVVVETTGYTRARLFVVSPSLIKAGLDEVNRLLALIQKCKDTGNWEFEPEYLENPYTLSLVE